MKLTVKKKNRKKSCKEGKRSIKATSKESMNKGSKKGRIGITKKILNKTP